MRIVLLLILFPFSFLALISVFGLLISMFNGSSNLMIESFAALIISGGILLLIAVADKSYYINKGKPAELKSPVTSDGKLKSLDEIKAPVEPELSEEAHVQLDKTSSESIGIPKYMRVSGVSYPNKSGLTRQECIEKLSEGDPIWLEREPNNRHDKNAIRIMSIGGQIGYMPKEHAANLAQINTNTIIASFVSKGMGPSGLWGCTIELTAQELATSSSKMQSEEKTSYSTVLIKDGRAYPHPLLLQELDSLAAEVFSPDDDIKIIHSSLGEGEIIKIQGRSNANALITVRYAAETCKHRSDIFSSNNISSMPESVSMKDSAIHKYIKLLPRTELYRDEIMSSYTDSEYSDSDEPPFLSVMDMEYAMSAARGYDYFEDYDTEFHVDKDNGYDDANSYWHEYHKHD